MQRWKHEQAFLFKMFILILKFPWPLCIFGKLFFTAIVQFLIKKKTITQVQMTHREKFLKRYLHLQGEKMLQSKKIAHLLF